MGHLIPPTLGNTLAIYILYTLTFFPFAVSLVIRFYACQACAAPYPANTTISQLRLKLYAQI